MVDSTVATATLQQFNAAVTKINQRDERISELERIANDTLPQATLHSESRKEIAELKKLNQKDREFVATAFKFYEDITGEAVGINGLFNQEKEPGKE